MVYESLDPFEDASKVRPKLRVQIQKSWQPEASG
jgi:hypothetical protein